MNKYEGLKAGPKADAMLSGAKQVAAHGWGNEMFNFQPFKGRMYGHAPVPHGTINVEKLGAAKGAESVDGVLVIWVAKSRIVGWYKNATVYRRDQLPKSLARSFRGRPIPYHVTATAGSDCKCIDPDARLFSVPRARQREGAMGRYSWFAEGKSNSAFRAKVFKYVESGGDASSLKNGPRRMAGGKPYQPDLLKRLRVEEVAMDLATRHFKDLGYEVKPVHKENLGWDLKATHRQTRNSLKLEVKGLSGREVAVELTPNEYTMMKRFKHNYRVCVATGCLGKSQRPLNVLAYNDVSRKWVDGDGRPVQIGEVMSARLRI
jgi:hypothetical protein